MGISIEIQSRHAPQGRLRIISQHCGRTADKYNLAFDGVLHALVSGHPRCRERQPVKRLDFKLPRIGGKSYRDFTILVDRPGAFAETNHARLTFERGRGFCRQQARKGQGRHASLVGAMHQREPPQHTVLVGLDADHTHACAGAREDVQRQGDVAPCPAGNRFGIAQRNPLKICTIGRRSFERKRQCGACNHHPIGEFPGKLRITATSFGKKHIEHHRSGATGQKVACHQGVNIALVRPWTELRLQSGHRFLVDIDHRHAREIHRPAQPLLRGVVRPVGNPLIERGLGKKG